MDLRRRIRSGAAVQLSTGNDPGGDRFLLFLKFLGGGNALGLYIVRLDQEGEGRHTAGGAVDTPLREWGLARLTRWASGGRIDIAHGEPCHRPLVCHGRRGAPSPLRLFHLATGLKRSSSFSTEIMA